MNARAASWSVRGGLELNFSSPPRQGPLGVVRDPLGCGARSNMPAETQASTASLGTKPSMSSLNLPRYSALADAGSRSMARSTTLCGRLGLKVREEP